MIWWKHFYCAETENSILLILKAPPPLRMGPNSCTTTGGTYVVGFVHGSCSSEASRGYSGVNKQMDHVFYLYLTGVGHLKRRSGIQDSSPYTDQIFKIQISNGPGFGIQISYEPYLSTYRSQMVQPSGCALFMGSCLVACYIKLGFKFQSGYSGFTFY